jgi:hypothetical protein
MNRQQIQHQEVAMKKDSFKIRLISMILPLSALVFVMWRKMHSKKKVIKEEIRGVMEKTINDIDRMSSDLKAMIENKTIPQLEKTLDSAVLSTKTSLDKITGNLKSALYTKKSASTERN